MKHLLVVLVCVSFGESVKLPASFMKCNRNQPDLNDCLLKAGQHGSAQLTKPFDEVNLPSLDPLVIPEMTIGAGTGPVNLEQKFKNCKLYGLNRLQNKRHAIDFDKKILDAITTFPELKFICDYEVDGKILLLPVVGKGEGTVILKNVEASIVLHFEEVVKKGKTHLKFVSSKLTLDPSFVSFNLENLFNGDKTLGDNINQVMNDNWQQVFADVKSGYVEVFNQVIRRLYNNFFAKVSVEEAFD